ncbi:MAG: hypothetical protein P4L84_35270 [Isosphaeraceae bacterium]|nr:hypothetical protein [Isosphaeraceae bacterium]
MRYDTVQLNPPALAALDSLKQPGRGKVLLEIHDLINDPENRSNVQESDWAGAPYMLVPDADPSLRVYFRIDEQNHIVEIVDLIRPEALRSILMGSAGRN